MRLQKRGFTLVELIVVITILAILWTIWFVSLMGYQKSARDSVRISDMKTMAKALELYHTREWELPLPSESFEITFSGSSLWSQGSFGDSVVLELASFGQAPRDPAFESLYSYSVTYSRQEYELAWVSEKSLWISSFVAQSHAAGNLYSRVYGNYNGKVISLKQADTLYVFGVPTLITTRTGSLSVEDILSSQSFAIDGSENLAGPSSAQISSYIPVWVSSFTPGSITSTSAPILYSGSEASLSQSEDKQQLGLNISSYYGNSNIAWDSRYSNLGAFSSAQAIAYVNDMVSAWVWGLDGNAIALSEVDEALLSSTWTPCVFEQTNIGECDFQ